MQKDVHLFAFVYFIVLYCWFVMNILNLLEHYYMLCSIYGIFKERISLQNKRVATTLRNNKLYITFDKTKCTVCIL